jgi:histidine triad (HIT) family protein
MGKDGMSMANECVFCELAANPQRAHAAWADALTLAFMDPRQFHPGHTLVIPRRHYRDVRELDFAAGAALMATVSLITRAVADAFPSEGISLWHSIGPAGGQEVPHLHVHVHPRRPADQLLRVYPSNPPTPDWAVLDQYAKLIRAKLRPA